MGHIADVCDGHQDNYKSLPSKDDNFSFSSDEEGEEEEYSEPEEPIDLNEIIKERGHLLLNPGEGVKESSSSSDQEEDDDTSDKFFATSLAPVATEPPINVLVVACY